METAGARPCAGGAGVVCDVSKGPPCDAGPYGSGAVLTMPKIWNHDAGRGPADCFIPVEINAKAASLMAARANPWEVAALTSMPASLKLRWA